MTDENQKGDLPDPAAEKEVDVSADDVTIENTAQDAAPVEVSTRTVTETPDERVTEETTVSEASDDSGESDSDSGDASGDSE